MIVDTRWPDNLFQGSPETLEALRAKVEQQLQLSRPPTGMFQ
jgi:hypothetical protein